VTAWVLDTSVLIPFRDGDERVTEKLLALNGQRLMSIVSRVELEGGVARERSNQASRRLALDLLLTGIEVLSFGDEEAEIYGQIVEKTGYSRRKILDRMIAAQALIAEATLVTFNPEDFVDIPDLRVLSL
jgi:tRNA(fMet)-specific endonuclease VapC